MITSFDRGQGFCTGTAIFIAAGGGAFFSGINSMYTQTVLTGEFSLSKVASDALLGALANGLCTGTSSVLSPVADNLIQGCKYAISQVSGELIPGFLDIGTFVVIDLMPTIITGFGAWCGGLAYDYYAS